MYDNSELSILNNKQFYYPGIEAVESALEISKNINISIDQPYNIFVYWIGDNVNYKHSVVIKSFLVTQSLKNATLKIYSDKDISNKECFLRYKNFPQVEFHIFDVYNETANTKFSNLAYKDQVHNHSFNPAYESDFFRLLMLHKHGGVYIDFDVLILRDLSPLINYNFLYIE